MDYYPKTIRISFDPSGYAAGDYCQVHSNGGSGAVNWTTPHDNRKIALHGGEVEDPLLTDVICTVPGAWLIGFESYDTYGNSHNTGTPAEASAYIELKPKTPSQLEPVSYVTGTEQLTFNL